MTSGRASCTEMQINVRVHPQPYLRLCLVHRSVNSHAHVLHGRLQSHAAGSVSISSDSRRNLDGPVQQLEGPFILSPYKPPFAKGMSFDRNIRRL